jgi:hypothetical protein
MYMAYFRANYEVLRYSIAFQSFFDEIESGGDVQEIIRVNRKYRNLMLGIRLA